MPSVQHASPAKDAIDGPLCGQRFDSAGSEGLEDHLGPEEAQVTIGPQTAPHFKDQVFDSGLGPLGVVGDWRAIGPIDPVEALALGMVDPTIDSGGTHVEVAGDLLLRPSPTNGLNHRPTTAALSVSLLMVRSSQGVSFPTSLHRDRSSGCGS
jgi:hypothetical protein